MMREEARFLENQKKYIESVFTMQDGEIISMATELELHQQTVLGCLRFDYVN